jgi:hypothetical protein
VAFIWFFVEIRYLRAMRKVLMSCAPKNRRANVDRLWLEMIPIAGFYWQYANVLAVSSSLGAEARDAGAPSGRPGLGRGMATVALQTLALIFLIVGGVGMGVFMPDEGPVGPWPGLTIIGIILLLGSFLVWYRYWAVIVDRVQPRLLGE